MRQNRSKRGKQMKSHRKVLFFNRVYVFWGIIIKTRWYLPCEVQSLKTSGLPTVQTVRFIANHFCSHRVATDPFHLLICISREYDKALSYVNTVVCNSLGFILIYKYIYMINKHLVYIVCAFEPFYRLQNYCKN